MTRKTLELSTLFLRHMSPLFRNLTSHGHRMRLRNYCVTQNIQKLPNTKNDQNSVFERRCMPKTKDEYESAKALPIVSPKNSKMLTVALLGLPNSGKSTLTNKLMQWEICPVSKKVHTTRKNVKAIYVDDDTQVVFIDTPGLIDTTEKKKHNLTNQMLTDPENSLKKADVVMILVDAANKWTRHQLDKRTMKVLQDCLNKESILVLNKVDLIKDKHVLLDMVYSLTDGTVSNQRIVFKKDKKKERTAEEMIEDTMKRMKRESLGSKDESVSRTAWPSFKEVFMISALENDGIEDLRCYLLKQAKPGLWKHPHSYITDQNPKDIILDVCRANLLNSFPNEIPYLLKLTLTTWDITDAGCLSITVDIHCHRKHLPKVIIGSKGSKITKVADETRQQLMNIFQCDVILKFAVHDKE